MATLADHLQIFDSAEHSQDPLNPSRLVCLWWEIWGLSDRLAMVYLHFTLLELIPTSCTAVVHVRDLRDGAVLVLTLLNYLGLPEDLLTLGGVEGPHFADCFS
jgi:hypothetical protein